MKKLLAVLFFIMTNVAFSSTDSHLLDSIGIEKKGNQTFIVHQVTEKETLFGISKRYGTTVNDLVQNNEVLQVGLKAGQRILIPYTAKSSTVTSPAVVKEHKVSQGETLFSISKTYGVSVGDLMSWNNLKGNDLAVGQTLKIEKENTSGTSTAAPVINTVKENTPITKPVTQVPAETPIPMPVAEKKVNSAPMPAPVVSSSNESFPGNWITHTVAKGETLFSISKRYGSSVDEIMSWNGLSSSGLKTGQRLKVGRENATSETVAVIPANPAVVEKVVVSSPSRNSTRPNVTNNEPIEDVNTGFKNIKETGLAEVIEGSNNHKKYLVLHRTAPVGTIMRVRNEENDITIFARVVGKLPETGDNSRLVVKLSKAAYDQLRAVNARFPVEISF